MQEKIWTENLEKIKKLLRGYKEDEIEYNKPHFTLKLEREKIDRKEVVKNMLKPDKLILVGVSASKNPNYLYVYDLYFQLGKNRLFKIPTSMKSKRLYLITIFKIRRKIHYEAIQYPWK